MCALIYLLYERLRGEILRKREQKQRQRGREKEVQKISSCLCFLLYGDEIFYIFFKKNFTAAHLFSCYFDMYFSFEKSVLD